MAREMSQASLFEASEPPMPTAQVRAAEPSAELLALSQALAERWGPRLALGTSSWHFPGWAGLVWDRVYAQPDLSKHGLAAYARHPLLRTVSLDRAFHQVLDAATYRRYAAQVDDGFRFMVKAPAAVSDAMLRAEGSGAAVQPNPLFLDPRATLDLCVKPALEGLGAKLGVLVFQISPLPRRWLEPGALIAPLEALWQAVVPALPTGTLAALELRDPGLLTPALAAQLKAHGVRCCLGLHDRMPPIDDQLPAQRALWPGDLVCRWNLQRGLRYARAKERWEPFDRLQAPDPTTRATLARVMRATLDAGHRAFVIINNKAEGSAPLSVLELAQALRG
jgi:uncharacterized protein YecE (DUF72 family)